MATIEECEEALGTLAEQLAGSNTKSTLDRTLSCKLTDLDQMVSGRFDKGKLVDIQRGEAAKANIRLTTTSDNLLSLVNGEMNVLKAWTGGKLKIDASMMDMLKLRELLS